MDDHVKNSQKQVRQWDSAACGMSSNDLGSDPGSVPRRTRRLVQLYSALLHNAYIRGFIDGRIYTGSAKFACAPGLNCYSCPGAVASCPLGALQNALASAGHRAGWYAAGILLLFGVILGRTICGWLCPMGLIQELLNKIPTPKIKKSRVTRTLTCLKYIVLAVFVIAIPLWYGLRYDLPLPGFCKYICPAGTLEGAGGHLVNPANASYLSMLGVLFTRKFIIMLVIGLTCVFCYRAFCRFLCPLGAIYALFNRFSIIGVSVDANRCNRCGACVRGCGMDVQRVGDRECIHCGRCMDTCAQSAISVKAGRITLRAPDTDPSAKKHRGPVRAIRGVALAVMCFALLWFNILEPARTAGTGAGTPDTAEEATASTEPSASDYDSNAPIGHEVGNRLADFTLTCYDGTDFRLADTRGKVTFINLWATYCTPCIQELPWFSALYAAHRDDIAMIAVHDRLVTEDPAAFLAGANYDMPFATDTDDRVKNIVGGTGTLPQTVVLNRKGEVVYNRIGSVTSELLSALYDEANR